MRYIRPILKWAAHPGREYVARDLTFITAPAIVRLRQRVLSPEELAKLLPVLRASDSPYATCMQFILLTLCRREEAAAAKWRDVDFTAKRWRLPETKGGNEHNVQLSQQAIALLRLPGSMQRLILMRWCFRATMEPRSSPTGIARARCSWKPAALAIGPVTICAAQVRLCWAAPASKPT